MEKSKAILEKALQLKPHEKYILIETLIESLDKPDTAINDIWIEEAEKRLSRYREGKSKGIPYKDIFNDSI